MATRVETIVWGTAPEGAVVDHAVLTIVGMVTPVPPIDVKMGDTTVSVDLVPDTYAFTLQAVDAALNPIGAPVTDTFTIEVPITFVIPVSMTGTTN